MKAKTGYTKPDNTVRCRFCSVGVDESGQTIGGLIASQRVTCQMEPGRSIHVATIQRCINDEHWRPDGSKAPACNRIAKIEMEFDGRRLNLSEDNIRACCQQSQGNQFDLTELETGKINIVECPMFPKHIHTPAPDYDPNKYTEQEVSF